MFGMASTAATVLDEFAASAKQLNAVSDYCLQHMDFALGEDGGTQIPSYVTNVPTGQEKGVFLAVDLGGTNCRICSVDLHGDSTYTMNQKKYAIPPHLMVNDSHQPLFDYVAEKTKAFLDENNLVETRTVPDPLKPLELGFTFSFTYESHSLSRGTMLQWDKGWDIPDAVGRDPLQMLQDALDRLSLPVSVAALTNDSVGTLMADAYTTGHRATPLIGAILGTGTNAAYVERLENVRKLRIQGESLSHSSRGRMVINTEWGAWFDENPMFLPTNQFDEALDKASVSPGTQLFEKRVSGMYLGELARLAIMAQADAQSFDMQLERYSPLEEPYALRGSLLTLLSETSSTPNKRHMSEISTDLGVKHLSLSDVRTIRSITAAIVKRSARLSAAAMAAIITKSKALSNTGSFWMLLQCLYTGVSRAALSSLQTLCRTIPLEEITARNSASANMISIGIDGSVFELYPHYEQHIREALRELRFVGARREKRIRIGLAKDGSSLGAALIVQSSAKNTQQISINER